jgi:hypothetical protein
LTFAMPIPATGWITCRCRLEFHHIHQ